MEAEAIPVKLVIVGDGAIGKTCILVSYAQNRFPKEYQPTIFDNFTTTLKVDNRVVNLGLWDTAGQEYARLRPLAYSGTDVFLIAFSVIQPSSLVNAKKKWYPELQQVVPEAIKIFVGNKIDLRDSTGRQSLNFVTTEQAIETLKDTKCSYLECSALTRVGLKEVFEQSVRSVLQKKSGFKISKKDNSEEDVRCNCQII